MYCRCEHDGHDMDAGVCSTDVFRRREWYRTVSCEGGHGVCKDRNDAGGIKEKMLVDQRLICQICMGEHSCDSNVQDREF